MSSGRIVDSTLKDSCPAEVQAVKQDICGFVDPGNRKSHS